MSLTTELELDRPLQDVRHEAVLNIVRTATMLSQRGSTLFRKYGLTEAQFNVLFSLKYKERPWTQSDLGKRLVVTRASVTSVLDKLEEKGLVERIAVSGNRRIYHVELTEKGHTLIAKVEPVYRSIVHRVLDGLSEGDLRGMIMQMETIRTALHDED
ncbi:MAG: MarR family transcriptional regulator [Candidatus Hydrogenedentes bacterium]|nr:MarR family transcriptional regulator [Candidatus Hydrogenedentota bacterium]